MTDSEDKTKLIVHETVDALWEKKIMPQLEALNRRISEHTARTTDYINKMITEATEQRLDLARHIATQPADIGKHVSDHVDKYHDPVKHVTVIGGIVAAVYTGFEILKNFFFNKPH